MKIYFGKLVITMFLMLAVLMVSLSGCIIAKETPAKVVGEWVLEGEKSEVGVWAGTTGKIDGKDYLFLATVTDGNDAEWRIRVLDLNNSEHPVEIGNLKAAGNNPIVGLELLDDKLYVLAMDSLMIIDVSNPSSPREISKLSAGKAFNRPIAISGRYVYLGTLHGITVVDISDSANTKEVDSLKVSARTLQALEASNSLLLAVEVWGVHIFDISSPGCFKRVGFFANPNKDESIDLTLPPFGRDFFFDVAVSGKYAYIASGISGLRVLDLSNPAAPSEIANLRTKGTAIRILISGNLAYVIDWQKSLLPQNPLPILIINISNPSKPVELGSVEVPSYFNFNFAQAANYIYYFGNDPRIKIIRASERR